MKKLYAGIKIAMLAILLSMFFSSNTFAGIIVSQPRNATVCEGSPAVSYAIKVNTIGYTSVTYQWYVLPYKSKLWVPVSSSLGNGTELSSKLVMSFDKFTPLTTSMNNNQYKCVITGRSLFFGTITESSASAYLYVTQAPPYTPSLPLPQKIMARV